MDQKIKENVTRESTWMRLVYMVLFAVIFNIAEFVIVVVVVVQFLFKLFTGDVVPRLQELGQTLGTYVGWVIRFLTYNTEEMPYPFGPWPGPAEQEPATGSAPAKRGASGKAKGKK